MAVKALVEIIRPLNSVMSGFAVIVALSMVTGGDFLSILPVPVIVFGFLTGFFVTASSMVFNDYFDKDIDLINEPNRPIPRGDISATTALAYGIILGLIGIFFASLINLYCLLVALIGWFISILYNGWGKKTGLPGNMMVSFCVTIPFIFAQAMLREFNPITIIFIMIVFFANTGREIIKGIADVAGDLARGVRTIAVVYGEKTAAKVASLFYLIAVALTPIPVILNFVNLFYIVLILIVDVGFVLSSIIIVRNPKRSIALREKKRAILLMLLGLIAFMVGTIR